MAFNKNIKLLFVFALAALFSALASADNALISKVCAKHTDANFCNTELGKASFTDLPSLATASLDMTKAHATDTKNFNSLLVEEAGEMGKKALKDCVAHYNSAAAAVEAARASFNAKDYWKMNSDASSASTFAVTCEDGFTDAKVSSPLTSQNNALKGSAQIVAIVANMLDGKA